MWAIGMWSFAAVNAPANVEFVSPGTITRLGFSLTNTFSSPIIIFPVCQACVPDLMFKLTMGSGNFNSSKNSLDIS